MVIDLNVAKTDLTNRFRSFFRHWAKPMLLAAAFWPLAVSAGDEIQLKVRPGDTLIGICQHYLDRSSRWPALKKLNRIDDELHLVPGSHLRLPVAWLRWSPGRAEVVSVLGDVRTPQGKLAIGDLLKEEAQIDTGSNGLLTLRFRDGATVAFPPGTQASLDQLKEIPGQPLSRTAIKLDNGSAESHVPRLSRRGSRFEIRSPRIVTAVRGTRFRVGAEATSSRHEVIEGRVRVTGSKSRALLTPGQGLRADDGQVGSPVSLLPAPDLSALPATLTRTVVRLSAPPSSDAAAWRWQIASDSDFIHLLKDEKTRQASWVLTGIPDGDFFLRLRAIDAAGIEGMDAVRPLAVRARPEPPVVLSPSAKSRLAGAVAFRWTTTEGSASTHLQIAKDADFTQIVMEHARLSASTLVLDSPLPPGDYFWRLASRRADDYRGPFGDGSPFTQLAPNKVAPPEIGDGQVNLSWSGPDDLVYGLQIADDEAFTQLTLDKELQDKHYVLLNPATGTHFVRTRPLLPDGSKGPWSATQAFEVPGSAPWWLLLMLLPVL